MPVMSKRLKVKKVILDDIRSGRLLPGCKIDSDRELSAKLCVSRGTLSKGLNELMREGVLTRQVGKGTYVSEQIPTVHRVRAKNLTLGLVVSCASGPVAVNLIEGLHQVFPADECDIIIKDPGGNSEMERSIVSGMLERMVDAVVVSTSFGKDSVPGRYFYEKVAKEIPVVMTDCVMNVPISSVSVDNYEGGRLAASMLCDNSSPGRLLLAVKYGHNANTLDSRINGFDMYSAEQSINTKTIILPKDINAMDSILKNILSGQSDGIFLTQGGILSELLRNMEQLQLSVNDFNVCVFDDFSGLAKALGVSYIEQPFLEVGREIANLVNEMIAGVGLVRKVVLMPALKLKGVDYRS